MAIMAPTSANGNFVGPLSPELESVDGGNLAAAVLTPAGFQPFAEYPTLRTSHF